MSSDPMLTVEEAQRIVLDSTSTLDKERIILTQALDRILAEDIAPRYDIPPHDNSSVDGYAVQSADVVSASREEPAVLNVIEDIPAGKVPQQTISKGQSARIMTGAVVPPGADAVVMVENTDIESQSVSVYKPVVKGQNVRYRGEDVKEGQPVLKAGTVIGAGEIGLLAAFQRSNVTVRRTPTVAILSTGDEVVDIDEPLEAGKIVNSNSYSLAALVQETGCKPLMLGIAKDTEKDIRQAIESAMRSDFILSTGGVSVGDYDFVKKVILDLGADMKFWRVRMKPGKPLAFGVLHDTPFFGFPGNPVSCMVSFLLFGRPALRKAMGHENLHLPIVKARLDNDLKAGGDRRHYLRAQVRFHDGHFSASTVTGQGSGMLSSMVGTNGLVIVETGVTSLAKDSLVDVLLMRHTL